MSGEAERLRCLALHHEANAVASPLPLYQAVRLALPRRQRARWFAVDQGGRTVATALRYDLRIALADGRVVPAFGLGGVATSPTERRRGLASALCAQLIGGRPAVLFSAIPPALYERLGFRVAPHRDLVAADPAALAASGRRAPLRPLDPRRALDRFAAAWNAGPPAARLFRDEAGFLASVEDWPTDLFFAADEGYVRVHQDPHGLELVECTLDDRAAGWRAVAGLAAVAGLGLSGWAAATAELEPWLTSRGRERTLPMVRPADGVPVALELSSADYF